MATSNLKTVCFFTRRYDDLITDSNFNQKFYNQYFWVKYLDQQKIKVIWVFGAEKRKTLEHELGTLHFVPDFKRTKLLLQKSGFYKETKMILEQEKVNLVIGNGINDITSHFSLSRKIKSNIPIIVQDHASVYRKKYSLVSAFFKRMDGFIFNSPGQEKEWVDAKLVDANKVYFLPEGVSEFKAADKSKVHQKTTLKGNPIFLWVGNLVTLKDPLTCLKAFREIVKEKPTLTLYMIFQKTILQPEIEAFITDNQLNDNIFLIGKVKHEEIESYYQSADFFISSSLKEGSGYAAIEAMACNTIPILSDIPSFKHFTNNGEVGGMFGQGNHMELKEKVLELLKEDSAFIKEKVKLHYEANFSPQALANKFSILVQKITS